MNKTRLYKAFGLVIESCFPIAQIPEVESGPVDVRIVRSELNSLPKEQRLNPGDGYNFFRGEDNCLHRVSGGNLIEIDPLPDFSESQLGMYLMGSCMGAILHQRGFMLLHGSCVTDGKRAVLITGDSGAGKSTTAAEFLKRGWKLVTDDVTCLFHDVDTPMVQPSYPSQKLWQDAMDRYEKSSDDIHSLYVTENREKFGVNVAASFYDSVCPLSMIVRLVADDSPCGLYPIEGIAKVDQLMRNSYRIHMIEPKNRPRHFQRCVTLATKIPMALAIRENGKDCAPVLYDMITKFMEEHCHD